jgi:chemotaxis protein MotB
MMSRIKHCAPLLLLALLVTLTGCDDPKQRIALLEESNQQLMDDLNSARSELDALRQANDDCQNELASARRDADTLRGQLAAKPDEKVPAGWTAVPGGAMIAIEDSVLFDSGKAKLRSQAQRSLEAVASALRGEYSDKEILVFGHTDDQPIKKSGWQDNYELSAERALAVVRWLKDRGIQPDRLAACGCGEYRPRVPNTSATNRQKNRRVEIFALEDVARTASAK